jgi:hypothetical protein
MNGELDFNESLVERVKCLAGADESVFEEVYQVIQLTPGAEEFVWALRTMGYKIAVVSGGFNRAPRTEATCGPNPDCVWERGRDEVSVSSVCCPQAAVYGCGGGVDGIAKIEKRRGISVSSYDDQSHDLPSHPYRVGVTGCVRVQR